MCPRGSTDVSGDAENSASSSDAPPHRLRHGASRVFGLAIAAFVIVHLAVLFARCTIELEDDRFRDWIKNSKLGASIGPSYRAIARWTKFYVNILGVEQNWQMFAPPMSRGASFLAARVELDDGEIVEFPSPNYVQPRSYFRIGGWRQRKIEDTMVDSRPEDLKSERDIAVWSAYVRWTIRRWHDVNPEDTRCPVAVTLWKLRQTFPAPGQEPDVDARPTETLIGTFDPDGILR